MEPGKFHRYPPIIRRKEILGEKVAGCRDGLVYFSYSGRNAWGGSWVERYAECRAFSHTLEGAKSAVEERRVQGSTWWIRSLPALLFESPTLCLVVTEINTKAPLQFHADTSFGDRTIGGIGEQFTSRKKDSVIRLLTLSGARLCSEGVPARWKSESYGGAYPLGWRRQGEYGVTSDPVKKIVRRYRESQPDHKERS